MPKIRYGIPLKDHRGNVVQLWTVSLGVNPLKRQASSAASSAELERELA